MYSEHLVEWLRHFQLGRDLHIVDGDNLAVRPWKEMEKIQGWNFDPSHPPTPNNTLTNT